MGDESDHGDNLRSGFVRVRNRRPVDGVNQGDAICPKQMISHSPALPATSESGESTVTMATKNFAVRLAGMPTLCTSAKKRGRAKESVLPKHNRQNRPSRSASRRPSPVFGCSVSKYGRQNMATPREIEEVKNLFRRASLFEEWSESDTSPRLRKEYADKSAALYRAMNRYMRFFGVTLLDAQGNSQTSSIEE